MIDTLDDILDDIYAPAPKPQKAVEELITARRIQGEQRDNTDD